MTMKLTKKQKKENLKARRLNVFIKSWSDFDSDQYDLEKSNRKDMRIVENKNK